MFNKSIALFLIIILIPFFLIITIFILIEDGLPFFFTQKRVGVNYSFFYIYKFRSMKKATPNVATHLLINPDQYLLKVGKFIRKTSLDEIPQFFNILKGDMSFVGPRPALWNQYDLIEERDKYNVHKVLPGVTGWAQVNGRDELLIPDKAKLDGEYLNHLNLWTDIKLVIKTFIVVLKKDGVVEGGTKTTLNENSSNKVKL